jgi:hypothetical protein
MGYGMKRKAAQAILPAEYVLLHVIIKYSSNFLGSIVEVTKMLAHF